MRLGPAALTQAVVVFRCPKWEASTPKLHTHTLPAGDVTEVGEGGRVFTFKQFIECPTCWKDVGAFAPAFCHIVGIEWEPARVQPEA
jgi:hypothetical protein